MTKMTKRHGKNMTKKMPKKWEDKLLNILFEIQSDKDVYWIQTKHLARAMFGIALDEKEFERNKQRIRRLANKLEEQGKIETTYRRENIGKSLGRSLVKYYHAKNPEKSIYRTLKRIKGIK